MPRELSAAAKAYAGPVVWLAEITTPTQTHYFADDEVPFGGQTYKPYPRITGAVRLTRSLQVNSAEIELIATDLYVANLLSSEQFEGAKCVLKQLLLGLEETFEVIRGRLTDQELRDDAVGFRLISEPDYLTIDAQARNYAQLCTWRFKSPQCGYTGGATSCNKTFTNCQSHGCQHRFNGFPSVTKPLQQIYSESQPPIGGAGGGAGAGRYEEPTFVG